MSFERIKEYFRQAGLEDRIIVFDESSATVEMAADLLGCHVKQIAKTLAFLVGEQAVMVVAAGHMRVDNKKFKDFFGQRPSMIPGKLVEEHTGFKPGGVCPFKAKPELKIYLDLSLKESDTIYPSAGSSMSVIKLSLDELETHIDHLGWIDVCKPYG